MTQFPTKDENLWCWIILYFVKTHGDLMHVSQITSEVLELYQNDSG